MKFFKELSHYFYERTNARVFAAAVLVFVLFMVFILPRVSRESRAMGLEKTPDTSFIYTSHDLYQMAEDYGSEGRTYYIRTRFTFDVVWPLVYLFFLVTATGMTFRSLKRESPLRMANIIPFFGAFFDFLENTGASVVMYRYPLETRSLAQMTPIFTLGKWTFIGASFVTLSIGALFVTLGRLRKV